MVAISYPYGILLLTTETDCLAIAHHVDCKGLLPFKGLFVNKNLNVHPELHGITFLYHSSDTAAGTVLVVSRTLRDSSGAIGSHHK